MPAIMVAGVAIEGAPCFAKMLQGNGAFNFSRIKGAVAWHVVLANQVGAIDLQSHLHASQEEVECCHW